MDADLRYKIWNARALVGSTYYELTDLPARREGFDAPRASCTLSVQDIPTAEGGTVVEIDIAINDNWYRFFTGYVDPLSARVPPIRREINCVDENGKLRRTLSSDIVWSATSFSDAVNDLLDAAGITRIADVYDPGLTLGPVESVTIKAGESIQNVMRDLMDYGGTVLWSDSSGYVHVSNYPGIPTEISSITYAEGAASGEFPLYSCNFSVESAEQVINSFTATGMQLSTGTTPTATYTASAIDGVPQSKTYRFIQSNTNALTVATREVIRRARAKKVVEVHAPLNPELLPGMTILFRSDLLGYTVNTPALIHSINTSGPTMTMRLWTGASELDGYATLPVPLVNFSMVVEKQPLMIGGVPTTRYFVQLKDLSVDPSSTITGWDWTFPGTATPTSSTEQHPMTILTTLSGAEITLEATNADGQSASLTKPVQDDSTKVITRVLSVACGATGWRVMVDGEDGFTTYARASRTCTAVPIFNEKGSLLAGWDDGMITALTFDETSGFATSLTTVNTLTGQINALYVNEADSQDILVGHGNKLSRSKNGGSSFTELFDFGATVRDCQSSPTNSKDLRVSVDKFLKHSFDGGANWVNAITGANGTTCHMMANASFGHAAVFSGGATSADVVKFEEAGYSVDWSGVAVEPTGGTAITPMLEEQAFLVGDGDGNLYKLLKSGNTFTASDLDQTDAAGDIADGVRDGLMNKLSYWADDTGLYKLVGEDTYQADDEAAIQVGLGRVWVPRRVIVELLLLTYGGGAGNDGVWHYVPSTWTNKNSGLPTGWHWHYIVADKNNPDRWLLVGNANNTKVWDVSSNVIKGAGTAHSPVWVTSNAGSTFTAVTLTLPTPPVGRTYASVGGGASDIRIAFSDQTSGQMIITAVAQLDNGTRGFHLFKGTASPLTSSLLQLATTATYAAVADIHSMLPGTNGDVVLFVDHTGYTTNPKPLVYVPDTSTTMTEIGSSPGEALNSDVFFSNGRAVVHINDANKKLYGTRDYRTIAPAVRINSAVASGNIGLISVDAEGNVYIGGRTASGAGTGGVLKVLAPLNTPTSSIVHGDNVTVDGVRVDRQTRTKVAAKLNNSKNVYVYNGSWATVTGPTASSIATLRPVVEIINRTE